MTSIYTIGHSNHTLELFTELVQPFQIATLADIRSHPFSKHVPHFQKRRLSEAMAVEGCRYVFLGDALGGKLGHRDYRRRAQEPDFVAGVEQLIALAEHGTTAMMCAEEDPRRCHRRLLVTPALVASGIEVFHVRGNGTVEPEAELADDPQKSLF